MAAGRIRRKGVLLYAVLAVALAGSLAGCASTSLLPGHHGSSAGCAPDAGGPPAPAAQVKVVCGWASALRAGHLDAAAGFFHLPSLFYNETGVATLNTRAQAVAVNSTLSCGAKVISAYREGRYVNVLFRLTSRLGAGGGASACGSGIGQTARTRFLIHDGKILAWLRAASTSSPSSGSGSGQTV